MYPTKLKYPPRDLGMRLDKTHQQRDLTIRMCFRALYVGRYNSFLKARARSDDPVDLESTRSTCDLRRASDPTLLLWPRRMHSKLSVELSPTR